MQSLGAVLKAAVLAGLIAGLAAAAFHSLLIEPVIDRAIELEERRSQAEGKEAKAPVVDRPLQRVGLVVGFLLYGAVWGALFGTLFHVTRVWQPAAWTGATRGLLCAALAGWSVAVFPFLKYPANPPGVGDPGTIGYRQGLYFGFIGLSVVGTTLAVGVQRLLSHPSALPSRGRLRWAPALALYAVYSAAAYTAMPANPDPVRMPAQLVWTFRAISLAGLALFWVVLGGAFGWLCLERAHRETLV